MMRHRGEHSVAALPAAIHLCCCLCCCLQYVLLLQFYCSDSSIKIPKKLLLVSIRRLHAGVTIRAEPNLKLIILSIRLMHIQSIPVLHKLHSQMCSGWILQIYDGKIFILLIRVGDTKLSLTGDF